MANPDLKIGSDEVWQKLLARIHGTEEAHVSVGVLASKGGDEQHDEKSGLTLLQIAAIHEFGSPAANIPERSFIRLTLAAMDEELQEVLRKLARKVVMEGMEVETALAILGQWCVAQIRGTITGSNEAFAPLWDPLKPATIAAKGSDRPLVDTGRLLQAIQYEVRPGSGEGA